MRQQAEHGYKYWATPLRATPVPVMQEACTPTLRIPGKLMQPWYLAGAFILIICCRQAGAGEWMEGPDGVLNQIEQEDEKRLETADSKPGISYARWKQSVREKYGLSFGLQYLALYQRFSPAAAPPDGDPPEGAGDIFRINGSYEVFDSANGDSGWIEWRIENRHHFAGLDAPADLGRTVGIQALNTAEGYLGDFHTDLSVLNWTQLFADRWGYTVGRLSYASYLDAGYFQSFSSGFLNAAFISSPALAYTGVGALGFSVKGFVSPHWMAGIQMHDANAKNGEFDPDTIRQNEYLSAVELGWTAESYKDSLSSAQLTLWHKDALAKAGTGEGYGLSLNATLEAGEFIPFLHILFNNSGGGVLASRAVSTGFEYRGGRHGIWSAGLAWADPVATDSRNEFLTEASYRFDLFAGFELMMNLQYIRHSALPLQRDDSWLASMRLHLNL